MANQRPTHRISLARDVQGSDYAAWTPIADLWVSRDGKGLTGPYQGAASIILTPGVRIVISEIHRGEPVPSGTENGGGNDLPL